MAKVIATIVEDLKNQCMEAMANSEPYKMIYCYPTVFTKVSWDKQDSLEELDRSAVYPYIYGCDMEDSEDTEVYYSELCAEWVYECIIEGTLEQEVTEIEAAIDWVNNPSNIEMLKKFA